VIFKLNIYHITHIIDGDDFHFTFSSECGSECLDMSICISNIMDIIIKYNALGMFE